MEPETLIHHLVSPICVLCSTQTDVDFRVLCQLCICIDASGAILGMCKFLLRFSHLSASNIYKKLARSLKDCDVPDECLLRLQEESCVAADISEAFPAYLVELYSCTAIAAHSPDVYPWCTWSSESSCQLLPAAESRRPHAILFVFFFPLSISLSLIPPAQGHRDHCVA